jgi:cytoskeletal protein CcmA (bactofilin family)
MRRYVLVAFALILGANVVLASPAEAGRRQSSEDDRRITVTGDITVSENQLVNGPVVSFDGDVLVDGTVDGGVFVGNGNAEINGRVTGRVFVAHGNVLITGRVGDDVTAADGRVTVRSGARVLGDVVSRQQANVAPGTVSGDVKKLNLRNLFTSFLIVFLIGLWIAVTVSVAILGLVFLLVFPRAADAAVEAGRRFWPSVGWGALVGIVGPILAVAVLFTVIGLPLGFGMLSGLNVLAPLGYVAASLVFGRLMVKGTSTGARIGAFFAGFGILRGVALIPGIGFIVWFLVSIYGIGALTIAAWRAGHGSETSRPPASPPDEEAPPPGDEAPPADEVTSEQSTPGDTEPARAVAWAPGSTGAPAAEPETEPGRDAPTS